MKISLRILCALMAAVLLICMAGCKGGGDDKTTSPAQTTAAATEKAKVIALNGPTGLAFTRFKEDRSFAYDVTTLNAPDEIAPLITTGEADFAALPLNLAANLYNKTNGGVKIIAVSTLGILSIVENGSSINSMSDLKGKTLYATGKGATPEYILNYLLRQNGLDPERDVTIEYLATHGELATLAIEGKAGICMLPEPFASKVISKGKDYRRALSLTSEWSKVNDVDLAQGCIVVRTEYMQQNPGAVEQFLEYYKASVSYLTSNNLLGAAYLAARGALESPEFAIQVLPLCNIVYIDGEQMKDTVKSNLQVLFDSDPACVGGKLPDDTIYYVGE